jgi:uncharacterized protein (TIGR03546 family)
MYTLIKFIRWVYKTLNSDARPWQIALAVVLGALAGLLPLGFGTLCVFVVILLVNVHFGSAVFAFLVFRLLSWSLQLALIRPLGALTLERLPPEPLIAAAQTPVVSWLRLDYFDVAGAIVLWALIAVPLYLGMSVVWGRYRHVLEARLKNSKLFKWASSKWLFRGLRYVFIGRA